MPNSTVTPPMNTGASLAEGSQTIAIVGAGIVGVSTAIWLQRAGHHVTLIDRLGPAEGTSYGNAGVLASCSIVPVTVPGLIAKAPRMLLDPNSPLFLRWSYLPRLAPWLIKYLKHCNRADTERIAGALALIATDSLEEHQALAAGTGAEGRIAPSDYVFVYKDRAAFEADAFGWSLRKKHGFRWQELEGSTLSAYEPALGPANSFAAQCMDHGHITDPGRYVKELAAHVERSGGAVIKADVTDIARENGKVTGVVTKSGTIPCRAAVIATGVWSKSLCAKLGLNVPLESERGYHVELYDCSVRPKSPLMIASGKFVATPMEGRLRLAGIVEFGGLDAPPSSAPFELLLNGARQAFPTLRWSRTEKWMGHRPVAADSIPLIGEIPGVASAYVGFGHQHIGLTAGPRTGRLLASLINKQGTNLDLAPFSPVRFNYNRLRGA